MNSNIDCQCDYGLPAAAVTGRHSRSLAGLGKTHHYCRIRHFHRFGLALGKFRPGFLADFFMIAATLVAGYKIALSAWQALRFRVVGINALVTLAAVGATIIGEYWKRR